MVNCTSHCSDDRRALAHPYGVIHVVLIGLSKKVASDLRAPDIRIDRASSAAQGRLMLRGNAAPQLMAISERVSGAGDLLADIEGDARLSRMRVVLVGVRSALSAALRASGTIVVHPRQATERVRDHVERSLKAGG
jgi:hypothetical protein